MAPEDWIRSRGHGSGAACPAGSAGAAGSAERERLRPVLHGQHGERGGAQSDEGRHRGRAAASARPGPQRKGRTAEAPRRRGHGAGAGAGCNHAVVARPIPGLVEHAARGLAASHSRGDDDAPGRGIRRGSRGGRRLACDANAGIREPQRGARGLGRHVGALRRAADNARRFQGAPPARKGVDNPNYRDSCSTTQPLSDCAGRAAGRSSRCGRLTRGAAAQRYRARRALPACRW